MASSKPTAFPIPQQHRLSSDCKEPLQDSSQYHRLIGRLIYLISSRPDITYAVQLLSQFMQKPCQPHLDDAYYVLRYLKSSPGRGLFSHQTVIFISKLIVMPTGQIVQLLDDQLLVITFSLVMLLYRGSPRNNPRCHVPLLNQNIALLLPPLVS